MLRVFRGAHLRVLRGVLTAAVAFLAAAGPWSAVGQTAPAKDAPDGTYTLHVYTDLLQIPTVVLTRLHSLYPSLTKQSFTLSLQGGPPFHPVNVRLQGDDPITLAILFDLTTGDNSVFQSFAQAMTTLPAGSLTARDYVSVYAYDCKLVSSTEDEPATPQHLQDAMTNVMTAGRERARDGERETCWSKKRLYDVIARVAQNIGELPGRRVVLVISDGADRQSVNDWMAVARFAGSRSITVFGLRPISRLSWAPRISGNSKFDPGWVSTEWDDSFGSLCGSTGGLVLDAFSSKKFMARQIQRLMAILRNRYIIEFPRPANGSSGYYSIDVKIGDPSAIIRPAGVAFPPRDRDAQKPEGTLPSDTSQMPVVGSKPPDAQPK